MNWEEYLIIYIGDGKFQVKKPTGEILEAGPNLCGVIRYTYFEDYTLPEINWEIYYRQLMLDYIPKMQSDVLSGKLKPNQINK